MQTKLLIFFTSMLPVSESRVAIPLGITMGLSQFQAFFYGTLGNIVIILPLILFLEKTARFLSSRSSFFERFFNYLFEKTRRKHSKSFERYGALALVTFVAIPLPGTGGWSGVLAAFIFGIKPYRAFILISLGIIIAGILVSFGWEGILKLVSIYRYHVNLSQ